MFDELVVATSGWVLDWYIPLGVGVFVLAMILSYRIFPAAGRQRMSMETYLLSERQRKQRMHALLADGIAELLLDLLNKGEMTNDQYRNWHLRFGTQLHLPDLLPKKFTPEELKRAIKARVRSGFYKPIPFFRTETPKSLPKPGNKLDAILAQHRRKA